MAGNAGIAHGAPRAVGPASPPLPGAEASQPAGEASWSLSAGPCPSAGFGSFRRNQAT